MKKIIISLLALFPLAALAFSWQNKTDGTFCLEESVQGGTVLCVDANGGLSQVEKGVETVTAANTILATESGKTFYLNSATEFASTLPAPAAGLNFKFVVVGAPSGASYTIVTASSANIIIGHVLSSDLNAASDGDFETSGGDTITIVDSKAVKGDVVQCESDGTSWYCSAEVSAFDAVTITTAS